MKTKAIVSTAEMEKSLRGGMKAEEFKVLVEGQLYKSAEIDRIQAGANEGILRLHWEIGKELLDTIFKSGTQGIKAYAEYTGLSETRIRRALSFASAYTRKQLDLAIKQGLHMGAIDALLRVGDSDKRMELGARVAEGGLTTKESRELVKGEIAKEPEIEKPTSKKRSQEASTQRQLDTTNPFKAVPKCLSTLRSFTDSCTNLVESFANLRGALEANSKARKGLIADMEDLKEAVSSNRELLKDMEEALSERITEAKSVKK